MEDLIKSSIINGLVFSVYDKMGPQPIYFFPPYLNKSNSEHLGTSSSNEDILEITLRDYTQISIKNLSLLIGDGSIFEKDNLEDFQYFGVIPHPDFETTSLTYFHFVKTEFNELPVATAFSILISENRRSFLYNNMDRLKAVIIEFFSNFDDHIKVKYKPQDEVESFFRDFINKLIEIEKSPSTPFSSHRKMKIIFAGLDNSGKTSFLLSVDRKYSRLIGLSPTRGAHVSSIEALGATIFLWDLGGQLSSRKQYLEKAKLYLYEADLLFYFIDVRDPERIEESINYFQSIKKVLNQFNQNTPIIFILSKGDPDLLESGEVTENVVKITQELSHITSNSEPEIYLTSIFQIFTILRAFSSGISKLSPNRELIKHNLYEFSTQVKAYLTLLLSNEGLVLADYFTSKAMKLTKMPEPEDLINVFEVTAPQFAIIYKIFNNYKSLSQDEAIFKVAKSIILIKRIQVSEFEMFILFLLDKEEKKHEINQQLPDFLSRTQDLLLRYIS